MSKNLLLEPRQRCRDFFLAQLASALLPDHFTGL
jgi:hypothetical protein